MPRTGLRPHTWHYPDPRAHKQHGAYNQTKAQCLYRGEPFLLTFAEFQAVWDEHWEQRGRRPEDYCMVRKNTELPWQGDNVAVIQRMIHFKTRNRRKQTV